jgi:hypothetical protein
MKPGDLAKYNSRLLLVLGLSEFKQYKGWIKACEVDTQVIRVYHPNQLTIIKNVEDFYS